MGVTDRWPDVSWGIFLTCVPHVIYGGTRACLDPHTRTSTHSSDTRISHTQGRTCQTSQAAIGGHTPSPSGTFELITPMALLCMSIHALDRTSPFPPTLPLSSSGFFHVLPLLAAIAVTRVTMMCRLQYTTPSLGGIPFQFDLKTAAVLIKMNPPPTPLPKEEIGSSANKQIWTPLPPRSQKRRMDLPPIHTRPPAHSQHHRNPKWPKHKQAQWQHQQQHYTSKKRIRRGGVGVVVQWWSSNRQHHVPPLILDPRSSPVCLPYQTDPWPGYHVESCSRAYRHLCLLAEDKSQGLSDSLCAPSGPLTGAILTPPQMAWWPTGEVHHLTLSPLLSVTIPQSCQGISNLLPC